MTQLLEQLIPLFHWVWSVSAMASVLVGFIIVMQKVLKAHLKPRWHYILWLLVILRLIMPWSPESKLSIYNWVGTPEVVQSVVHFDQAESALSLDEHESPGAKTPIFYRLLLAAWLLGVVLLGTYTLSINLKFARKLKQETAAVSDERIRQLFSQSKKRMGIQGHIALVASDDLASPSLFGFMKPQLIMPTVLLHNLNDEQLQHVFLHELAHSKRKDIWVNGFMHALLIIHWFNPILWYAYRRMREDQEIASDALALSCLAPDKSQAYGYTLITLLESFSKRNQVFGNVNLAGNKAQLQRRILMIKQFKLHSYRWSFLGLATMLFISGCTLTSPDASQSAKQSMSATATDKPQETASPDTSLKTNDEKTATSDTALSAPTPTPSLSPSAASSDKQSPVAAQEQLPTASARVPQPVPAADQKGVRSDTGVRPTAAPQPKASTREESPRAVPSTEPQQIVAQEKTVRPAPVSEPQFFEQPRN
ncbi:methicillin resistance protein [Paenibacillus alba]|uniref:M56 family metallopeptidase n=1 Tax=Paenibacillus alba TaxID=1197127 RepID=UPI00156696D9|nr:methicillin resistance protein [Paenibacillus alba]